MSSGVDNDPVVASLLSPLTSVVDALLDATPAFVCNISTKSKGIDFGGGVSGRVLVAKFDRDSFNILGIAFVSVVSMLRTMVATT